MSSGVALVRSFLLVELATEFGGAVTAIGGSRVDRVVAPNGTARDTDLQWIADRRWLRRQSAASDARTSGAYLCDAELATSLAATNTWRHTAPRAALAALLTRYASPPVDGASEIDPTASVASSATIEAGVTIGPRSVVGPNVVLHRGTQVGADVVIGAGSVIGQRGFGWAKGPAGARAIPHFGGVVIEDRVAIGALSTVDAGTLSPTRIGHDTKLDSHVHVGHNVRIGAHCLVAAQCGFAGSVEVGDGVEVGGQAGFADHVVVGTRARIAAKSGVIGDVPDGAVYAGYPAVERGRWLRGVALALRGERGERDEPGEPNGDAP